MKTKLTNDQFESCALDMTTLFETPAKTLLEIHAGKAGVSVAAFRIGLEAWRNRENAAALKFKRAV